jgi:pyruvate dehydrogenase E2 component (dihydrolipoamide acetyltransferase)
VEIEAEEAGILRTRLGEGQSAKVGVVIATIGDGASTQSAPASAVQLERPADKPVAPAATKQPMPAPSAETGDRIKASPLARRIARERGVLLESVRGTGPNGRIVEADVLGAAVAAPSVPLASPAAPIQPAESGSLLEMPQMRKIIARRMVESKTQIPHYYVTSEIDMGAALEMRKQINALDASAPKVTVNDLIVRATALAIMKAPAVNRALRGDRIYEPSGAHVGIAVSIDDGLIVPVIRDAQAKSLREISREARDLVDKARTRRLQPADYAGGSFTVSNMGIFDVENFLAIIDPSQGAILAVGSIRKIPIVLPDDTIGVGQRMNVTLSGDHRAMDGAAGAKFLLELKRLLQNPFSLLNL